MEPTTRKFVKGYGFLPFTRNLFDKYGKKLLDSSIKTRCCKKRHA